ncbi:MAG: site-specific integrase [Coprobacillus sp.]|nr:site-specific integrase [Coprobacillus sp.]
MPTYYDDKTKTWFCQFRYTDYTGTVKQKRKRGFKLQREAKEWERSFLEKQTKDLNMSFNDFVELYLEDMSHRLKPKTLSVKIPVINKHILPYFKNKNINDITAIDIRQWQNTILSENDFSQAYLKKISAQINAIFNYATNYYDLKNNPCKKAGSIGSHKSREMAFYTLHEFKQFMANIDDLTDRTIFYILYYTGMRKGELFALQKKDIDLTNGIIDINKSYQRINAKDIITSPKTPKSIRKIEIPTFLIHIIQDYIGSIYGVNDETYLFMHHYVKLRGRLKVAQKKANLHEIRIHDFRHSHASLLIELGYSPLLIADRLGDNVETTLKVYSHLYPSKQSELVQKLDTLNNDVNLMSNTK